MSPCDPTRFLLKVRKREPKVVDDFGCLTYNGVPIQRRATGIDSTYFITGTTTATAYTSGTYGVPYYWSSTT